MSKIKTLKKIQKCCAQCENHADYSHCDWHDSPTDLWQYCDDGFSQYSDRATNTPIPCSQNGNTKTIRAAVAIDTDGRYDVRGWDGAEDEYLLESVDCFNGGKPHFHFITAEVSLPKRLEIEGDVE